MPSSSGRSNPSSLSTETFTTRWSSFTVPYLSINKMFEILEAAFNEINALSWPASHVFASAGERVWNSSEREEAGRPVRRAAHRSWHARRTCKTSCYPVLSSELDVAGRHDLLLTSESLLCQNAHKVPPPWLIAMQRYGPPPSYPNLKIPGLNSPIPDVRRLLPHAQNSADHGSVFFILLLFSLLELYVWLSCWRLGKTASRWNGQASLWWCVRDQFCRLPGEDCTLFAKHTPGFT